MKGWGYAVGNDALHLTQNLCSVWIMSCFLCHLFLPAGLNENGVQWGREVGGIVREGGIGWLFRSSRRGLNGCFDLSGHPLLLSSRVLADKGAVLVELSVLVAVVHQAVPAVPSFDLSAQRALAALQWLLVVVAESEGERERCWGFRITSFHPWLHSKAYWRGLELYHCLRDESWVIGVCIYLWLTKGKQSHRCTRRDNITLVTLRMHRCVRLSEYWWRNEILNWCWSGG